MNNLQELAKKYNEAQLVLDDTNTEACYYESVLLNYKGVMCYVDEMSMYHEYVILRVNAEDMDRFSGNHKTVKLTLKEFDEEVNVMEEESNGERRN